MAIPIDPSLSTVGSEWKLESPGAAAGAEQSGGGQSFGGALSQAISSLEGDQSQAAGAAQSLVDGSATDASSVVMSVERARLEMQLASQIRTKAVEAYTDVFHTQV
jgi:flagellar hook-basal body complex protein FliE